MLAKQILKILFFQNGRNAEGNFYNSSPGLLPMIGDIRRRGFDISFYKDEDLLLKDYINSEVDIIAISAIERTLFQSVELAKKIRETGYDGVLMIGGNTLNYYIEDLAQEVFDIVVGEESEHIFSSILYQIAEWKQKRPTKKDIESKIDFPSIITKQRIGEKGGALDNQGVQIISKAYFKRGGKKIGLSEFCIRNGKTGLVYRFYPPKKRSKDRSLSVKCYPEDYEIEQMLNVPWDIIKDHKWITLEIFSQRGCPWGGCVFCSMRKSIVRSLSNEVIIAIAKNAKNHGIFHISFSDDMFVQNIDRTRELLKLISDTVSGIRFRAQTKPNRLIWNLLEPMAKAGFEELYFGVETLNARRIEFLGKTKNGEKYLRDAKETIIRTAAVGIIPVLYMILIDPRSTLDEVASDIVGCIKLLTIVYKETSILPRISWSLTLLPIHNGMLGKEYPYSTISVNLGKRSLRIPSEYYFPDDLVKFIERVKQNTNKLPLSRDSFEILEGLMISLKELADQYGKKEISQQMIQGLEDYTSLKEALLNDIFVTAHDIIFLPSQSNTMWWKEITSLRYNFYRFASFYEGINKYFELLQHYVDH